MIDTVVKSRSLGLCFNCVGFKKWTLNLGKGHIITQTNLSLDSLESVRDIQLLKYESRNSLLDMFWLRDLYNLEKVIKHKQISFYYLKVPWSLVVII